MSVLRIGNITLSEDTGNAIVYYENRIDPDSNVLLVKNGNIDLEVPILQIQTQYSWGGEAAGRWEIPK